MKNNKIKLDSFESTELLADNKNLYGGMGPYNGGGEVEDQTTVCGCGTCTGSYNMTTGKHTADWDDEGCCG